MCQDICLQNAELVHAELWVAQMDDLPQNRSEALGTAYLEVPWPPSEQQEWSKPSLFTGLSATAFSGV